MPYRRESAAVLAMWRDVERQMLGAPLDSPEYTRLTDEWARLRTEYARLSELAAKHERPSPTLWPIAASTDDPKRELADRSSEMLDELEHLKATELLKRRESISTVPFHELADEVTASSRRIFGLGAEQEQLGDEAMTGEASIEDFEEAG